MTEQKQYKTMTEEERTEAMERALEMLKKGDHVNYISSYLGISLTKLYHLRIKHIGRVQITPSRRIKKATTDEHLEYKSETLPELSPWEKTESRNSFFANLTNRERPEPC